MTPIYAIGDIHGQRAELEQALEWIEQDGEDAPLVFVGDYIDRGPDSRGVIEMLMRGQAEGRDWTCLSGNHDPMLPDYLAGPHPDDPEDWIGRFWPGENMGGKSTLRSYGVDYDDRRSTRALLDDARAAVPQEHIDWLRGLPRMHLTDEHIFVHAGILPGVPLEEQDPEDLVWIRHDFLDDPRDHGRLVVHGHTPVERPEHCGNRVNLDGGAGFGRTLYPVLLLGREAFLIDGTGRTPL